MMNTKHTPGPWHVTHADPIRQPDVLPCIDAPDAEVACGVFRDADACLIAAAPELLAALEGLLADKYLSDPINADRMATARAAIAKATEVQK